MAEGGLLGCGRGCLNEVVRGPLMLIVKSTPADYAGPKAGSTRFIVFPSPKDVMMF